MVTACINLCQHLGAYVDIILPIFINEASSLPIPSTRDELMVVIIKQCAFLMLYIERYYEDQMIEIINRTEFLQVNDTSLQNMSFLNIIIDDDKIGIIVENNNAHSEANSSELEHFNNQTFDQIFPANISLFKVNNRNTR